MVHSPRVLRRRRKALFIDTEMGKTGKRKLVNK
jgi:hypothetical protein